MMRKPADVPVPKGRIAFRSSPPMSETEERLRFHELQRELVEPSLRVGGDGRGEQLVVVLDGVGHHGGASCDVVGALR